MEYHLYMPSFTVSHSLDAVNQTTMVANSGREKVEKQVYAVRTAPGGLAAQPRGITLIVSDVTGGMFSPEFDLTGARV